MKRWMAVVACLVVGSTWSSVVVAQERIYRCGNEYTNNAAVAKQRNCQVVDGGHVTVVHTNGGSTAAKSSSSDGKPTAAANRAVKVDAGQQKARDSDAKAILQEELSKAKSKLSDLKAEYNDGNPTKTALELRNPQAFFERVEALKANIARQEADVAGIERELARHTGG